MTGQGDRGRGEAGGECVAPTAETIADGTYPISRSLYIYVNAAKAEENPAVAAYVDFYLTTTASPPSRRSATWPCPTTSSRRPGRVWEDQDDRHPRGG